MSNSTVSRLRRMSKHNINAPSRASAHKSGEGATKNIHKKEKESKHLEFGHDIRSMIEISFGAENDSLTDNIGGQAWYNFWTDSLRIIEQRRFLPAVTSNKNRVKRKEPDRMSTSHNMSSTNFSIPEGNEPLKKTEPRSAPALRAENESLSQEAIMKATSELSKTKQLYLMKVLDKMEDELGFGSEDDQKDTALNEHRSNSASAGAVDSAVSDNRRHPSLVNRRDRNRKYGRSIVLTDDDVSIVLRKIGAAMFPFKDPTKLHNALLNYDLSGVSRKARQSSLTLSPSFYN